MTGAEMHRLMTDLFPLCRSITGEGLRATLRRLQQEIPLTLHEVPSGTAVLDWTVPREWNIRDAWVKDVHGTKLIDFGRSNLHVVSYSVPVEKRVTLAELKQHCFTLPDHPDWIPYRTSYYEESWGFCCTQRQLESLREGEYDIRIDSSLAPGSLTYGECVVPGESTDEILVSTHCCHPSLANDNLTGIAVATALARSAAGRRPRLTYRFLFLPGTIGSITWLALHEEIIPRIRHGLVLSCLGDRGPLTYKQSRRGDSAIDRASARVLKQSGVAHQVRRFEPYGYDERQYCSPGFNLPIGSLTRTPHGQFPEYHSSADDLEFVSCESLEESLKFAGRILDVVENDVPYVNRNPKGEPQLGRRGLYRNVGGTHLPGFEMALLWVLSYSDGEHSLQDIAERAGMPFATIRQAAAVLEQHGLLSPAR